MSAWKMCAAVLPVLALVACGRSSSPGSPTASQPASQNSALSFGRLVPAAAGLAQTGQSVFGRCLSGSGELSCFGASSLPQPRVVVTTPSGATGFKARAEAAADTAIPDAPLNLVTSSAPQVSTSSVFVQWTKPATGPAPTNYLIEAGSASGRSDLASFLTGNTLTFFATSVTGTGTFYVRVHAVTAGGVGPASNESVLVVIDPAIPVAPFALQVRVNGTTVTLTWFAPNGGGPPTTYVIQAASSPGGPANLANFATGNTATTLTATNVGPGTYFVRVLAANNAGVGPPTPEQSLIVLSGTACTAPPTSPVNLVSLVAGSTVTLGWTPGTGSATSYVVEAGSASGLADLASADTGSTNGSATFAGVGVGTYFVRVKAKNNCGVSTASNEIQVVVR
jgi:hypothetical protein